MNRRMLPSFRSENVSAFNRLEQENNFNFPMDQNIGSDELPDARENTIAVILGSIFAAFVLTLFILVYMSRRRGRQMAKLRQKRAKQRLELISQQRLEEYQQDPMPSTSQENDRLEPEAGCFGLSAWPQFQTWLKLNFDDNYKFQPVIIQSPEASFNSYDIEISKS